MSSRKSLRKGIIYGTVLGIFVILLAVAGWRAANVKAGETQALLREQQLTEKRDALKEELTRVDTDEYVIERARAILRMVFPGETLYIINPSPEVFLEEDHE